MTDCRMQVINDDLRSLISNEIRSLPVAVDVVAGRKKFGWRIRFDSGFCFLDIYLYVCICVYFFMCILAFLYFVSRMPASRGFGWRIVRLRRRFFFFFTFVLFVYTCCSKLIVALCLLRYCQLGCDENWKAAIVTLVFCPGLTSSLLGGFSEPDIIIWLLSGHKKDWEKPNQKDVSGKVFINDKCERKLLN